MYRDITIAWWSGNIPSSFHMADLLVGLLGTNRNISPSVDQHCMSFHINHYLVFHFATLPNFLLDRNLFPLMYCLYIRRCQTWRNVKDCRATCGCLGVGKKYQLMSLGLPLTELQPIGGLGSGVRERTKETLTPDCVTICWHYKIGESVQKVGLALWFLSDLSKHSL